MMQPVLLAVGMTVELKKPHPCGNRTFTVVRTGADVKFQCTACGHVVLMSLPNAKKAVKRVIGGQGDKEQP